MRQLLIDGALQEGVVGANDLKVVQRGAGANMSVDVGAGFAWVQIDTGTRNGMGHVTNDAVANVTVTASNGTNPRIDQIILRWNDTSIPTGSGNVPTLAVLTGTATAGATLDNRTGAAALPNDCLRLADLLIPTSSTSVVTANIRDRRPWSRGAYFPLKRTAGSFTIPTVFGAQDTTNLRWRIEAQVPLTVQIDGVVSHTTAGATVTMGVAVDSVVEAQRPILVSSAAGSMSFHMEFPIPVTPGSRLIDVYAGAGATGTLIANATNPLYVTLREDVRQQANNGTA